MSPNVALLRETLAHIEAHPGEWDQSVYRCQTGLCFAGHAAVLAGGRWADPGGQTHPTSLVAEPADDADRTYAVTGFGPVTHVADRATRVLGLTTDQADDLFDPSNTLAYLRSRVAALCAEAVDA